MVSMKRKYNTIIFSILFFISFLINEKGLAQSATNLNISPFERFVNLGEHEGLTSKMIYCIIQDRDGYIWVGTNTGIFRYDGKIFKRFTIDDGITDNEVFSIYQDRKGRIWFLTFNGRLSFWKDGKINNPANTPFLKRAYLKESVFSCFEDSNGRIWFGSRREGFIVIKNDSMEIVKSNISFNDLNSVYVHEDLSGNIWSFKNNKMYKLLDTNVNSSITLPESVLFRKVSHGKNNETYFYTSKGVFKIFDHSVSLLIPGTIMPPVDKILNIFSTGEYIWLCTIGKGCYEYKNGKFIKNYFSNETITSAFRDREDNLWFGTMGNGIKMLPASSEFVTNFNHSTGLSSDMITSVTYSKNDLLWLGYGNGIVDEIYNGKKRTFNLGESNDLNFFKVIDIIVDSTITWLGTDLGVYYIENGKLKFVSTKKHEIPPARYSVKRIMKDSNGDVYATNTFNLLKVEKDKTGYSHYNLFDTLTRTFSIVEINHMEFIVSGISGLMRYIPGKIFSEYKTDIDLSSKRIIDMKLDHDSNLFLVSDGFGLYILNNGKLVQHFSTKEGLSDNSCNRITVSENYIFVATNSGLDILKKEKGRYFISDKITTNRGLLSNTVNDVALNNQLIYVATDKGLSVIKNVESRPRRFKGKINITEIITDTIQDLSSHIFNFKSNIPRLLIKFSYPVFNPDNQLNIKYRLLQNEKDSLGWIISTNNEIEFSSLKPGNYFLQLKLNSNDNKNLVTKFNFTIVPLWWQTTIWKVVVSLIILTIAILTIRRRIKKKFEMEVIQLKQQTVLEIERNRIASDMHDDVGAELTKISMWANIIDISKNDTNEMAKKIIHSSYDVMQKMDQIIWALDSVHDHTADLISYLRMFALKFLDDTKINLLFEVMGKIPDFKITSIQRRNIFLVIKELLHNTVKHSRADTISIKIYYEESNLLINYSDNGCGFNMNKTQEGLGFLTMNKRMKEINSLIKIYSDNANGTSVNLTVKLEK